MQNFTDTKSSPPVKISLKRHLTSYKLNTRRKNPAREKQTVPEKILKFLPEKKKVNPRKNKKKCTRKGQTAREKIQKSGREKKISPGKKPKKVPKTVFSGTFHFLG